MKEVRVAVIGAAGWIGGVHSECYARLSAMGGNVRVKLDTAVDVPGSPIASVAEKYGFERFATDYREAISDSRIDIVDVCASNDLHREVSIRAAEAGKHVICEKPLALNLNDALEMCEAVRRAGTVHMVNFVYRKYPAVAYLKELLESGDLGDVIHFRCNIQQDFYADPSIAYNWHFNKALAGGGALLTFASHALDMARHLVGDITDVCAASETFIKERPLADKPGQKGLVDVDDVSMFMCRFKSGALGSFHTSWLTRGRKHHFEFEVAGSSGTAIFDSERMNEIQLAEVGTDRRKDGFKTILVGAAHPYGGLFNLKTGMGIGAKEAFAIQLRDFVEAVSSGKRCRPDFFDGLEIVRYTEAIQRAADSRSWVRV